MAASFGGACMSNTLTKLDIIKELAERNKKYGVTVAATRRVVDGVFELIGRSLLTGKRIEVRNFGVFKVVDRAPRVARNPRTGERKEVPARKAVKYVPGRMIEQRLQRLMQADPQEEVIK
jgi:nucleoid DNA-binding protein